MYLILNKINILKGKKRYSTKSHLSGVWYTIYRLSGVSYTTEWRLGGVSHRGGRFDLLNCSFALEGTLISSAKERFKKKIKERWVHWQILILSNSRLSDSRKKVWTNWMSDLKYWTIKICWDGTVPSTASQYFKKSRSSIFNRICTIV